MSCLLSSHASFLHLTSCHLPIRTPCFYILKPHRYYYLHLSPKPPSPLSPANPAPPRGTTDKLSAFSPARAGAEDEMTQKNNKSNFVPGASDRKWDKDSGYAEKEKGALS
ncbi:hypothetical protein E2C01_094840 [Portunus trituberculatus]|uniref:Uncharacterized protein n=1 Tax=Portunus trituberculatus TaxID=210409 RepID=A0A5B7K1Y7_PORTR|nr:hypothetical protein [Portunus trituberculatus]